MLDNTGSMADDGKIDRAQDRDQQPARPSCKSAAATNGDVYVSIIPFVKDVNLGASNWNSNYIYWGTAAQDPSMSDNNSWDANNGSCSTGSYSTRSSCVSHSTCSISGYSSQSSCTGAGTCSISGKTTQSSCTGCRNVLKPDDDDAEQLHRQQACSKSQIHVEEFSASNAAEPEATGTWTAGTWTTGVWTAASGHPITTTPGTAA